MIEIKEIETPHGPLYGLYINETQIALAYKISKLEDIWAMLKKEGIRYHDKDGIGKNR